MKMAKRENKPNKKSWKLLHLAKDKEHSSHQKTWQLKRKLKQKQKSRIRRRDWKDEGWKRKKCGINWNLQKSSSQFLLRLSPVLEQQIGSPLHSFASVFLVLLLSVVVCFILSSDNSHKHDSNCKRLATERLYRQCSIEYSEDRWVSESFWCCSQLFSFDLQVSKSSLMFLLVPFRSSCTIQTQRSQCKAFITRATNGVRVFESFYDFGWFVLCVHSFIEQNLKNVDLQRRTFQVSCAVFFSAFLANRIFPLVFFLLRQHNLRWTQQAEHLSVFDLLLPLAVLSRVQFIPRGSVDFDNACMNKHMWCILLPFFNFWFSSSSSFLGFLSLVCRTLVYNSWALVFPDHHFRFFLREIYHDRKRMREEG